MNSYMNITVRVMAASAQAQMRAMQKQIAELEGQLARANRTGQAGFGAANAGLAVTRLGNSVQWTGRQLSSNFTIPITAAGAASLKFALDSETAMNRIVKVYGDTSMSTAQVTSETTALEKAFEALSNRFGVTLADTMDIAAGWAAAGASGIALAEATKLTMETMILGEVDAVTATEALIAIQAQYGQSVKELSQTIDTLNMVENQTGISMGGLIEGMQRAAGTARSAGVDVQHLAAFMAALVPAAGTAANAGNALKTIFSRLLSPTQEANQVLGLMGVNTADLGWKSLNAAQRLETLAKKFEELDDAQKEVVSTVIASRYQINKFDVLMRDITNTNGYYQKALRATEDAQANYNQRVRELNTVLTSNPRRIQIMWTILQNAMIDVIQPFIPMIVSFMQTVAQLAQAFTGLPPVVQKWVVVLLAVLALIGPLTMYLGSVITLVGLMARGVGVLLIPFTALSGLFSSASASVGVLAARFAGAAGGMGIFQGAVDGIGAVAPGLLRFLTVWWTVWKGVDAGLVAGRAALSALPGLIVSGAAGMSLAMKSITGPLAGMWAKTLLMIFAAPGALATTFGLIQYSIMGFFTGTLPALFTAARATLFTAAMRLYIPLLMGLTTTVPGILSAMQTMMFLVEAAFIRGGQIMLGASTSLWLAMQVIWIRGGAMIAGTLAAAQALWARVLALGPVIAAAWGRAWVAIIAAATAAGNAITLANAKKMIAIVAAMFTNVRAVLVRFVPMIVSALGGPWGIAIGIALTAIVAFREQIWTVIQNIVRLVRDGFNLLPASIQGPLLAVVRTIRAAALAVYDWFSYLNPFAHHSPSLVEQVKAGMAVVKKEYASVGNVGAIFGKAATDLAKFKNAVSALDIDEFTSQRKDVAEFFPGLLGQFNTIASGIKDMKKVLSTVEGATDAQSAVVDRYKASLDAANDALDAQEKQLSKSKDALQSLQDQYDAHEQALQDYASTSIIGMKAADDAIFANEQAQKSLQLQILKLQASGVKSVDELDDAYKRLQGDIENINGVVGDLRNKGAGSEITDPLLDQANAMRASAGDIKKQMANNPLKALQDQLDKLAQQGQIMDLEKSLKFDSLTRQIQEAANATKEMSFEDIIAGIGRERAAMEELTPQIDAAKNAVLGHEAAVEGLTAARDAAQAVYDIENQKLTELKDAYQAVNDQIRDMESALQDLASAANAARQARGNDDYLTPGAKNFIDAEGGNFPDVGGFSQIGREGGMEDQSAMIDQFTKDMTDELASTFGSFDMFEPFKRKWNEFVGWFGQNGGRIKDVAGQIFTDMFAGVTFDERMVGWFEDLLGILQKVGGYLYDLFMPEVTQTFDNFKSGFAEIWDYIEPKLASFKDLVEPGLAAMQNIWTVMLGVWGAVMAVVLPIVKIVWSMFNDAFFGAVDVIKGALGLIIDVIRDVLNIIFSLLAGDWGGMWDAVQDLFTNLVKNIGTILGGAGELIFGIVKGLVTGIYDFFVWLWDVLVGHSVVPDMVNAIVDWFRNMWTWVVDKVRGMKDAVVDWFIRLVADAIYNISTLVGRVTKVAQDTWDGFYNKSKEVWATVVTWLIGRGADAWSNLQDLIAKVRQIGYDAFWGLYSKVKDVWDNYIKPIFTALKDYFEQTIAPKVNSAIDSIGNAWNRLKEAAADPVRFLVNTVYNNGLRGFFNKVSGIIGGPTLPEVKLGFASGGVVPGGYSPGRDNTLAAVGSGEAIMRPEWTRAMGTDYVNEMNALAKKGGVRAIARAMKMPEYADGGVHGGEIGGTTVGGILNAGRKVLTEAEKFAQSVIKNPGAAFGNLIGGVVGQINSLKGTTMGQMVGAAGDKLISSMTGRLTSALSAFIPGGTGTGESVSGETNGSGWAWQVAQVKRAFPSIVITSTVRPGAETVSGNSSYHSIGRAIDMSPGMDAFNWLLQNYGAMSKEIIYSPAGARQIKNGRPYYYTGEVRDMHYNHVHWAYDQGGWLQPGVGQYVNKTGQPEAVLTSSQWSDMSTLVMGVKTLTAAASRMDRAVAILEARAADTTSGASTHNEYHFHGDLSFPNVKGGEDAEEFLDNLKTLAGV